MIAALVLAAGGSSRLGRPKQALRHRGRSLLRRAIDAALGAGCAPVIVVLGSGAERLREETDPLPVEVVVNRRWAEGMAGSIRSGVEAIRAGHPTVDAILLLVCDQPHLTAAVAGRVCAAFDGRPGRRVACEYGETVGPPALFESSLAERLLGLEGDRGAKQLLLEAEADLVRIPWPAGALEVDRPADLRLLAPDDPAGEPGGDG
jgi:molybdenum cofactor cytidylyltransferase